MNKTTFKEIVFTMREAWGTTKLADALGVTGSCVDRWAAGGLPPHDLIQEGVLKFYEEHYCNPKLYRVTLEKIFYIVARDADEAKQWAMRDRKQIELGSTEIWHVSTPNSNQIHVDGWSMEDVPWMSEWLPEEWEDGPELSIEDWLDE